MLWIKKLIEMKKASQLTTKDLYERSGVPIGTLNKLFAGQTQDPKLETIRSVVYAMGFTLNDLFAEATHDQIIVNRTDEIEILYKYRDLDDHGKETVRYIIDRELERLGKKSQNSTEVNSAPVAKEA